MRLPLQHKILLTIAIITVSFYKNLNFFTIRVPKCKYDKIKTNCIQLKRDLDRYFYCVICKHNNQTSIFLTKNTQTEVIISI